MPSQRKIPDRPTHGSIYTLKDPRDGRVRYVGQTEKSLQTRLAGHINQPTNNAMRLWTLILMAHGLTPIITEVATVRVDDLLKVEKEHIEYHADSGDLLNFPYYQAHLPDLGAEFKDLFAARVTKEEAADAPGQIVPPIIITVPSTSEQASGEQVASEQVTLHEHRHRYSFSLGGSSARRRPLHEFLHSWRWSRRLRFEIKWAVRSHPWYAVLALAIGAVALGKALQSDAAADAFRHGSRLFETAAWPVLATAVQPVRVFIMEHSRGVPATAGALQALWWGAGAVILFTNLLRGVWSRRFAWAAFGGATIAMVWHGSASSDRPISCGVTGLLWVLALAFV
ncbi:GIY-YIG nuclease family protein [Kitasatospora xanthocidica]|uniref:GIY-YIG nuclease family protein n=1 Tax=Kitasatospora xanthocidica TaxID=83382 RepID=UPI0036EBCD52